MKGSIMEVFGQEYDLSKCTPEELAEVEEWYEKNKDADVPRVNDYDVNARSKVVKCQVQDKSNELDIALAMESLNGHPEFNPQLMGKPQHVELYKMVHPLGGNLSVDDASKVLGINKVTAYRWLEKLQLKNPTADLCKWPTKSQTDVYRLIHPDLGGLTYREAAQALGCTYQHIVDMMARMRKTHPQAFSFEKVGRPTIVRYNKGVHDDKATEKI